MRREGGRTERLPVVAIIGVGLIGGSLGMAWRRFGGVSAVIGVEPGQEARAAALDRGAVDEFSDLETAVKAADVVVIATPVERIVALLGEVARHARPGTLVTDTGSTKSEVHRAARASGFPPGVSFIGGHPLAGAEASGVTAADPYLFENAFYILTTEGEAPDEAVGLLESLVRGTGAVAHRMTPEEHDRLVAAISHLPHTVAAAVVNAAVRVAGEGAEFLRFAAGGFRDTTRVAGSNPDLWRQILLSNAPEVLGALRALRHELSAVEEALERRDGAALVSWLDAARRSREALPRRRRGLLAPSPELVVQVEDRPGAIAGVTRVLADAGVNLREIEILHLREGEGGSLLVGVDSPEELALAVRLLQEAGYAARSRE